MVAGIALCAGGSTEESSCWWTATRQAPRIEGHYIVVGEEPEVSGHGEDVASIAQFRREDELIDPLGKLLLRPLGIPKAEPRPTASSSG